MSPSNRQLEERQMRKDRILNGALSVFKAKGLDGATMDEIASNSGFGKATLYYYFKSKEDVFSAILEDGWIKIWESIEPVFFLFFKLIPPLMSKKNICKLINKNC